MSQKAVAWAMKLNLHYQQKIALLVICDYHDSSSGKCNPPPVTEIANICGMPRSYLMRALRDLKEKGFVEVFSRYENGRRTTNEYILNIQESGAAPVENLYDDEN
jgi:DNA-binding MarR family transcriptional regulator